MSAIDQYLPENHQAHSEQANLTYYTAYTELMIPTPSVPLSAFEKFNKATGGFRPREFTILCGSTGTGKTTLMANWSRSMLVDKIPHFVASVETGRTDFIKRVISALDGRDINTGEAISLEEAERIHRSHGEHFFGANLWLSLYEDRFSVETLLADIAWHVKHKGCKVAIIDNLNFFLEVTSAANQVIEMDRVIHDLIIFCKQIDVHVVMVMHPKKTETGRVESEFDIKGSSTAVQEAHNVFLFNRPGADLIKGEYATSFDRELKIAKMRRKGRCVGSRFVLTSTNGVSYQEGPVV